MKNFTFYIKLISIIAFSIFLFYWFEIRLIKIRHNCSWIKIEEIETKHPKLSVEELRKKGLLKNCSSASSLKKTDSVWTLETAEYQICQDYNNDIIEKYSKEQKETIKKIKWRKASKREYEFCLHNNGL